jgi:alkanesulfonate monooxygenase SsuD/methylene tetrahydromethanopterin reductase-like flavin-dependent oxidoreductase (luciferase family)
LRIRKRLRDRPDAPQHYGVALRLHRRFTRCVYIADSYEKALEDLRPSVTSEISVQAEQGFLKMLKNVFNLDVTNKEHAIEVLAEAGLYLLGPPDRIAEQVRDLYDGAGGFGTFLIVTGKDWATREKRFCSMTRFMEQVAPQLCDLDPVGRDMAAE